MLYVLDYQGNVRMKGQISRFSHGRISPYSEREQNVVVCDQVLNKLREAEMLLSQGNTIGIICKKIGVSDHTYYRSG